MAAAVVRSRSSPSWVNREKAMISVSCSHQSPAAAEWACSGVATASQTLMSGKLNEFINLVVREGYMASRRRNQWRIKAQASPGSRWRDFFNGLFYAFKNQLARGAAFAGSRFVNPAMEIARQINRSTHSIPFHAYRLQLRL